MNPLRKIGGLLLIAGSALAGIGSGRDEEVARGDQRPDGEGEQRAGRHGHEERLHAASVGAALRSRVVPCGGW